MNRRDFVRLASGGAVVAAGGLTTSASHASAFSGKQARGGGTTLIKNADWVIAWDRSAQTHRYLRQADVAFTDDVITHVGKGYSGRVDKEIDGAGLCVMPGLINTHTHPFLETLSKGFAEENLEGPGATKHEWLKSLHSWRPRPEDMVTTTSVGYAELLKSGVTTVVDVGLLPFPGWVDLAARSGIRVYLAPMFTSTTFMWSVDENDEPWYDWTEDGGKAQFEAALKVIDEATEHRCGRLSGVVYPAQADTCTPELFSSSMAAAKERDLPVQTHAAQIPLEIEVIAKRHGMSPIKFLDDIGFLEPRTTVAHGIYFDHHPLFIEMFGKKTANDLKIFSDSGATLAHSPTIFARFGEGVEHLDRYRDAGINLSLGTDTFPHNMAEEMRMVVIIARLKASSETYLPTAAVFEMATIGGAKALMRDDLGRISPGAKADMVLLDMKHPSMRPARDPLLSFIHQAADRAVRDVYVDGHKVVEAGRVLTIQYPKEAEELETVQQRIEKEFPSIDKQGREAKEISPLILPTG